MRDASRLHGALFSPRRGRRTVPSFLLAVLASVLLTAPAAAQRDAQGRHSDAEINQAIIRESLAQYPGPCPCPYNVARNGSRCGKRSAYSRPGGYSPVCYESDVTAEMIAAWRSRHR
jgi:hypothetical protein